MKNKESRRLRMIVGITALVLSLNGSVGAQTFNIAVGGTGAAGAPGSNASHLSVWARTKPISGSWAYLVQSEVYVDTVTLGGVPDQPNRCGMLSPQLHRRQREQDRGGGLQLVSVPPPLPCQTNCGGSPILIPLGKSPEIKVSDVEHGVVFDIDGDGVVENVSWPECNAGFLAIDLNNNGIIDNGKELFGDADGSPNGFEKLLMLLGDISKVPIAKDLPIGAHGLDASFPLFSKLLVWHDGNRDGYSQANEIEPASNYLTKISLNYKFVWKKDPNGNTFKFQGWIEVPSGGRRPIYDVYFVTQ